MLGLLWSGILFIVRYIPLVFPALVTFSRSLFTKSWALIPSLLVWFSSDIADLIQSLLLELLSDGYDAVASGLNSAPEITYPTVTTLSSAFDSLDPIFKGYLDLFRVRESLALIGSVVVWRFGAGMVVKIFRRFWR